MANFNVAVVRDGEEIRFCHRLQPGAADRSYGIEVARLAGLPPAVLARAREIQLEMEGAGAAAAAREARPLYQVRQMRLFARERRGNLPSTVQPRDRGYDAAGGPQLAFGAPGQAAGNSTQQRRTRSRGR